MFSFLTEIFRHLGCRRGMRKVGISERTFAGLKKQTELHKLLSASHKGEVYKTYHKPEAVVKKVSLS